MSRIFPENRASLGLMARMGFKEIGVHEKHGKLDGVWKDCVIVELLIPENLD
jgi:RimJ/RimL family protein N-acetyltransferase